MNEIAGTTIAESLTVFLKDKFVSAGFSEAVIGVSGGVDSATSFALVVKALGAEHVHPVLLPYGSLSTQGVLDAMEMVLSVGIPRGNIVRIDIQPAVDVLAKTTIPDQFRKGNMMARVRMIYLYDLAKKYRALVVGTENRTEHLLGYFTRFGDEASDIEPLRNLYKFQVYELAKKLGVTDAILTKAPSAGLWPEQTDEGEFGFTYEQADRILSYAVDEGKDAADLIAEGVDRRVIDAVLSRMRENAFKENLPLVP